MSRPFNRFIVSTKKPRLFWNGRCWVCLGMKRSSLLFDEWETRIAYGDTPVFAFDNWKRA
jgi:hypothetical protein